MAESVSEKGNAGEMVIVDLGKQKRKRIRQLRKGEGSLVGKVEDIVAELRSSGTVAGEAQVVVMVVKEKRGMPKLPMARILR